MKKGILVTAILLIGCFILTGCIQGVPHKMLVSPWTKYEKCVYDVTRTLKDGDTDSENNKKINGTSTVTTTRLHNVSLTIGEKTLNDFTGTRIDIFTELEDGSTMEGSVAISNGKPYISHKKVNVKGYEHNDPETDLAEETFGEYAEKHYNYTNITNGIKTTGSIALGKQWEKAPYFDNLALYHIIRSSYVNLDYTSISLKVPSWKDNSLKTLNTSRVSHESVFNDSIAPELKCDQIAIQLVQTSPVGSGLPLLATITLEEANVNGMIIPAKTLYAFSEGEITYKLKTVEFTK